MLRCLNCDIYRENPYEETVLTRIVEKFVGACCTIGELAGKPTGYYNITYNALLEITKSSTTSQRQNQNISQKTVTVTQEPKQQDTTHGGRICHWVAREL